MADLIYRDIAEVLLDLPEKCALNHIEDGRPIIVMRGHKGFWPAPLGLDVDAFNERRGVTETQREAMEIGSMFGFDVPGADPLNIEQVAK
jgi:hypothetical protein